MVDKGYIAYYRVSTREQGDSGLGIRAQKERVRQYLSGGKSLVSEYQEVESGLNCERPELLKAIEECNRTNSRLIIAKLDRLSRNAKFIFTLRDSGVDFICADMPDANTMTIGLLAVIAEEEAKRTSDRTKSALAEIKRKVENGEEHISKSGNIVTSLGRPDNLTYEARKKGAEIRKQKAKNNPESKKAGAFIISLEQAGLSFYQITVKLNEAGFKTPRGKEFTQVQTKRLFQRYG